jgi:steroid delta-isomerase-like uncharacterized protein
MSSLFASPRIRVAFLAAGLLILGGATASAAEEPGGEMAARIARVEDAIWNHAAVEKLDEIYDPNCVLHLSSSMQMKGTEQFKALIMMFHEEIPDREFRIEEIISTEDRITERYNWRGTHRKSGKKLEVSGCVVYHVKEGKIVEAWNYEDMLSLYQQLGLVSAGSPFGPGQ